MNTAAPSAFPVDVHRQPSRDCRRFVALACIKIHPGTSSYVVLPIKGCLGASGILAPTTILQSVNHCT